MAIPAVLEREGFSRGALFEGEAVEAGAAVVEGVIPAVVGLAQGDGEEGRRIQQQTRGVPASSAP